MSLLITIFYCILIIPCCILDHGVWYYNSQKIWTDLCATGKEQSPIIIDTTKVVYNRTLRVTRLEYDQDHPYFNISNTGKTIKLSLKEDKITPFISGPALENLRYKFAGLHFHWSDKYMRGSEHRIDNRRHEMELHLVHYNLKYGDIEEALGHRDGLAVIAILFEVRGGDNPALTPIIRGVISVSHENNGIYFGNPAHYPIRLSNLFPKDTRLFYRYHGSLTTPGCNQAVTWLIYDSTNTISLAQFREFENLWDKKGQKMTSTYRQPQQLNGRIVESSQDLAQMKNAPILHQKYNSKIETTNHSIV